MSDLPLVEITYRNVYGRDLIYPVNVTAKRFATLAGTTTLSPGDLKVIEALGFTVFVATYIPQGVAV
jgi:hypothetical protein|tara:strand:- start:601 stop:801 length:201 start_codon:yes stop_codon:yes gene_type:complete